MNCKTSKEYVSQLLDNELADEFLQPLFQHLGDCEECRVFYSQTQAIQRGFQRMPKSEPSLSVEKKFDLLSIEDRPLMHRRFTISVPSALLSAILMFMISLLFVSFIVNLQLFDRLGGHAGDDAYAEPSTIQRMYYN